MFAGTDPPGGRTGGTGRTSKAQTATGRHAHPMTGHPRDPTYGEYLALLDNNARLRAALRAIRLAAQLDSSHLRTICIEETDRFASLITDPQEAP